MKLPFHKQQTKEKEKINLEKENINLENWAEIDKGKVKDEDGNKFHYVIEKNPLAKDANKALRLRVVKTVPKVTRIRTRYDPHIEVDGEDGAYVPAFFGYDEKALRKSIINFWILFILLVITLLPIFKIDLLLKLSEGINKLLPSVSSSYLMIASEMVRWIALLFVIICMFLPIVIMHIEKIRLLRKLKKEGLSYEQIK